MSYEIVLPSKFSRDYYQRAVRISQMHPLADFLARTWPGAPVMPFAGFMCNGGPDADTASIPGQRFHEIGYFGTTAGPSTVPYAPNSDTSQPNSWFRYRDDPRVRELLGRSACFTRDCWKASNGGFPDQCAIGLVSQLDDLHEMSRSMGSAAPRSLSSEWAMAVSFAAWSAGVGGATRNFSGYYQDLASYSEPIRWDALRYLMADDYYQRRLAVGRPRSHTNPAWTVIRTQHKFACATQDYRDDANDIILAMVSVGMDPQSAGAPPPSMPTTSIIPTVIGVGVIAASLAAVAYYARRWRPLVSF